MHIFYYNILLTHITYLLYETQCARTICIESFVSARHGQVLCESDFVSKMNDHGQLNTTKLSQGRNKAAKLRHKARTITI